MTTKAIFNIDKKLKDRAIRKAHKQGIDLSTMLNFATKAYVEDRLEIDVFGEIIKRGQADIRAGRMYTEKEVYRKLGIRRS